VREPRIFKKYLSGRKKNHVDGGEKEDFGEAMHSLTQALAWRKTHDHGKDVKNVSPGNGEGGQASNKRSPLSRRKQLRWHLLPFLFRF
jgi:hypothetical protein